MQAIVDALAPSHAPRTPGRDTPGLVRSLTLADGRSVRIRAVRPQDAELHQAFVRSLSPLSRMRRFHGPVAELPAPVLRYLTEVDQVSHLALLAETVDDGPVRQVAEARWVRRHDAPACADFAIAVADSHQGSGLGRALMDLLERSAAERGVQRLRGAVLRSNRPMTAWLGARGWRFERDPEEPTVVDAELDLATRDAASWRQAA